MKAPLLPPHPSSARKAGFVAIVGRPNAGKSTLLNQVLETELSIVTPKAQTTRERVLGILTDARGQIVFVDTPGIHRAREGGLNAYMVQQAREALHGPSVTWYIVDPGSALEHERAVLDLLEAAKGAPVFLLMNKADRVRNPSLQQQLVEELARRKISVAEVRQISARDGNGVKELLTLTWPLVPEGPFYYEDEEQISDRPLRFFVAEKIREQLMLQLGEEVPYSCAVEIEKFDEKSVPPRIEAVIHVERESQKGIVIGKGAAKIKDIGTAARKQIEQFLGHPVFLGLRVKVLADWTRNEEALRRMGYDLPGRRKS